MSTRIDGYYPGHSFSKKSDIYAQPSLLQRDSTSSYYRPNSNYARNDTDSGVKNTYTGTKDYISSSSKPQEFNNSSSMIPPLNTKKTESSNYPIIQPSNTLAGSILTRDLTKRTYAAPAQSKTLRTGVSIDRNYAKDKIIREQGLLGGQVPSNERSGSSLDGPIPESKLYNERRFLGIGGQIRPSGLIQSSSTKPIYGFGSPEKVIKTGDSDLLGYKSKPSGTYGDSLSTNKNNLIYHGSGYSVATAENNYEKEIDRSRTLPSAKERDNKEDMPSKTYDYRTIAGTARGGLDNSYNRNTSSSYLQNNTTYTASQSITTPAKVTGLVGLRNIGNTCFMNSILQSLFNTPMFSDYFLKGLHSKELNPKRNKGLAKAFAELLCKMKSHAGPPSSSAESTITVKRRIEESNSMFAGYEQHDAQEFLKSLLEGMNEDLNRAIEKQPYKELTADPRREIQQISNEWFDYMKGRDNSIVTDLFAGQLLSRTTCTHCKYESLAFDNFWDLSLSFTRGLSMLDRCDLLRMLEAFLKEEMLDDLFNCERCKQKRKFKKNFVIWRLPKILVIHLKRFHYGKYKKEKITHQVKFPIKNLDLSEFVRESQDTSVRDARYTLFAVVNHSGSLNGGHYTAECVNLADKKWYNFNDSSVRESCSISDKSNETAGESPYILFYAKTSCL